MKSRARFNISSVIDQFSGINNSILVNDGDKSMIGTAIPYLYNLYSDLITNPSTVSVSEYQKMVYSQPVLQAGLTVLNNLVKNEIGKYQHENEKYSEFINTMLDKMHRPLDDIITDMLTALWAGFYVGEKKYNNDGRFITIVDIEPRPAQSLIFRVDSQGNLKDDGIVQYYFNNLWTGCGNLLAFNQVSPFGGNTRPNPYASLGDFNYPWRTVWAQPIGTVIIPKNKCVHFAYKGLDGLTSPYGRSMLRPAYDSYLARTELTRILVNAANFKASPIPVIIANPDQTNTTRGTDAFQDIYDALSTLGDNGSGNPFLLLKGTKDSVLIDRLEATGNMADITALAKYFDSMMLTCVLFASELAGLSDKGSYALGKTQNDLLGRNVTAIANMIKDTLIAQVVQPTLKTNFNEQNDFGTFELTDNVSEDIALNLQKIQVLANQGIKLIPSAIMSMLDLEDEAIDSINNPILDTMNPINNEFKRAIS